MSETIKRRGRPNGSGKDDTALLSAVAGKLLENPAMKPSAAMKQVIAKSPQPNTTPETLLRRLQVKWKAQSTAFMDAARARVEAEARRERERASRQGTAGYNAGFIPHSVVRQLEDIQRLVDRVTPNMDYMEKIEALVNPPTLAAVKRVMEHNQRIQDLIDPPHMRAIRETIERMQRIGRLGY